MASMIDSLARLAACATVVTCLGCGSSAAGDTEYSSSPRTGAYDPEKGEVTPTGAALTGSYNGTVAQAAASSGCTTTLVAGLATQIVQALNCLHPNSFVRVPDKSNLANGSAVFPYMQRPARDALVSALDANPGKTLHVSSMLRTVAQQYLLYSWGQSGRCGIGLAARPGKSNHETGTALDTGDYGSWRSSLEAKGFSWFGSSDKVHFDFEGGGTVNIVGEDVRAFQMLWNAHNANDTIDADGLYGPATEKRLKKSPAGGFDGEVDCAALTGSSNTPQPKADDPGESAPEGTGGTGGTGGAEPSPATGCGSATYEGSCNGSVLTWCENEQVKTLDCSQNGSSCGWSDASGYYDCLAAQGAAGGGTGGSGGGAAGSGGSPPDPGCGQVTWEGQCSGDTLSYCDSGKLVHMDCGGSGLTCGYSSNGGYYDCLPAAQGSAGSGGAPASGCGTVTAQGECSGDILQYCENDQVVTVDCWDYNKSCGWNSAQGYSDCI